MTVTTEDKKEAHLLFDSGERIDDIKRAILETQYRALDLDKPTLRFRGTLVDGRRGLDHIVITGWQRNVARLRKLDVSLPTIVTMTLGRDGIIEDIDLDRSFKGSKGLMCNHNYLSRNLKSQLQGHSIDESFIHRVKQEKLHCAHLFEVASGIHSYYNILKENNFTDMNPQLYAIEEEAIDSYVENGSLHSIGKHVLALRPPLDFGLTLHGIMDNVGFTKNGILVLKQAIEASFVINGRRVLNDVISINSRDTGCTDLSMFLLQCIGAVKKEVCPGMKVRMFNTNLYPRAYIGMLVQSIAIRLFNNNYNYIMHALTSLQRSAFAPLCVGALEDQDEADRCFPGFSFSELV
jgi:hypothetical protein